MVRPSPDIQFDFRLTYYIIQNHYHDFSTELSHHLRRGRMSVSMSLCPCVCPSVFPCVRGSVRPCFCASVADAEPSSADHAFSIGLSHHQLRRDLVFCCQVNTSSQYSLYCEYFLSQIFPVSKFPVLNISY